MRIIDLKKNDSELLSECFGQGIADASDGELFSTSTKIEINPQKRSLIIGLGGSGIKTVNLVKNVLRAKCKDITDRVAFLAIDTDADDLLKSTTALAPNEKHLISCDGGDINSFYKNSRRNSFIDSWCTKKVPQMEDLSSKGANQKRQICKMKIFYPGDLSNPNDMKLLTSIKKAINKAMRNAMEGEELQVFIVLGVSGGTGSGGIIDIAQLVHIAVEGNKCNIIGIFFMPDAMPKYTNNIMANGYAALKELDYYISVRQREDIEKLKVNPVSNTGDPVTITPKNPLYTMPILISGSVDGIGEPMDKYRETRRVATEFIVNLLAKAESTRTNATDDDRFLLNSFLSNREAVRTGHLVTLFDSKDKMENEGVFGEDCFSYFAIGVSTVAIPERIIMSYAVDEIVDTLLGSSSTFAGSGFKGFDLQPMGRVQANSVVNSLLINGRAVDSKLVELCRLVRPNNASFDIDAIRDGTAATQYRNALGLEKFKIAKFKEADIWLGEQVAEFEKRAKQFMLEHGPRSFVCLCNGIGPNGETFDGLLARLNKLEDPVDRAEKIRAAKMKTERLQAKMNGFLGKISNWLGHHVETWHTQFLDLESSRIEEAVAEHIYGSSDHAFDQYFRAPVIRFIESCDDFAVALEELRKVYQDLGDGCETLEKFKATAQKTEPINVNILEGKSEYDWAKKLIDQSIRAVNFQTLKEKLVTDFMENQRAWTDYDPKQPLISPRRQFDALIGKSGFALQTLTLTQYFTECVKNPDVEAERIVSQLIDRARPRYNQSGCDLGQEANMSLLVPAQMFNGNPALKDSFDAACNNHGIEIFESHVEDKIVCYRFKCALPIYALAEAPRWENAYEMMNPETDELLHTGKGNDPDYNKGTMGVPWADRPPISYRKNIRLPGLYGQINREGQYFKNVIDPFFQQALEIGLILPVVYGGTENNKYTFKALILDIEGIDYSFDVSEYARIPGAFENGALQKGKTIAEYFANKNGQDSDDLLREIILEDSSTFKEPMPRAIAEDRAKRILRKNTPLFIHLKRSIPVIQAVSNAIDEANKISLSAQMIPTFAKSIAFDILREDEDHFWRIHLGGKPLQLCRMASASYESGSAAVLYEKGFRVKLLFDAFVKATAAHASVIQEVDEMWQPLVDNQAPMQQDYLDFLQWAKDEADARMAEYFTDRAMARRQLFRELHLEDEADERTEQMKALYVGIQRVYNSLRELVKK